LKELFTQIEINNSPAVVWTILTDLATYPAWNPFIPQAEGELKEGETLRIIIRPANRKAQAYRVKILKIERPKEFRWLGHFHMPGLIDGEHVFQINPLGDNKVQLIHRECFSGVLVPFTWKSFLNTYLRQGFEQLNQSLKVRAELAKTL
jgi:hypothetical protein